MEKKTIYLGLIFGSIIGSYIPALWGAGIFSLSSILGGAVGAFLGVWLMFKLLH